MEQYENELALITAKEEKEVILSQKEEQTSIAQKRQKFIFLLAILMVLIVFLGLVYNQWSKQQAQKKLRQQLTQDIHDNVGGILNNLQRVAKETLEESKDTEMLKAQLEQVATLSNQATVSLKDLIWKTKGDAKPLSSIEKELRTVTKQQAQVHNLPYELKINGFDNNSLVPFKVHHHFLMIYQEALQNAIKHGAQQVVQIITNYKNGQLSLTMKNAMALSTTVATASNSSFQGISNMQKRVTLLKGKIDFEVAEASFTLRLQLPLASA